MDVRTKARIARRVFELPTLDLAKALLGMRLVHESETGRAAGRIVEVEAYRGPIDKAAHSYGGRRTPRTEVMFGPPGRAYVYQIYGMYFCLNVVSAGVGEPEAVLVRALEPVEGVAIMAARRGVALPEGRPPDTRTLKKLTSGPGRLCRALDITKAQNGWDLVDSSLYLVHDRDPIPASDICAGPRINIDYAEEAREWPWRFWIRDNPFVSA